MWTQLTQNHTTYLFFSYLFIFCIFLFNINPSFFIHSQIIFKDKLIRQTNLKSIIGNPCGQIKWKHWDIWGMTSGGKSTIFFIFVSVKVNVSKHPLIYFESNIPLFFQTKLSIIFVKIFAILPYCIWGPHDIYWLLWLTDWLLLYFTLHYFKHTKYNRL